MDEDTKKQEHRPYMNDPWSCYEDDEGVCSSDEEFEGEDNCCCC